MSRPTDPMTTVACLAVAAIFLPAVGPAKAADLPFLPQRPVMDRIWGGGGFGVATVPVRPAPRRYDIYGYPVFAGVPSPLAVSNGCPAAIQPDYDADGNFAGYAPIPMCR